MKKEFDYQGCSFENDGEMVGRALDMARTVHERDRRKVSGEPYINHCMAVAAILKSWGADAEEVAAGLLHDTVEDHPEIIDLRMIADLFSPRVAHLVDGVTKLSQSKSRGRNFESLRKVVKESYIETGVALIKLADRVHNLIEMEGMPEDHQKKVGLETLRVYAPLAESFAIWQVKKMLEDMAFRYYDPKRFNLVKSIIDSDPRLEVQFVQELCESIRFELESKGVEVEVEPQIGGYWEMAQKQKYFGMRGEISPASFSDITDLLSVRVVIKESIEECYRAMGIVREMFGSRLLKKRHNDYLIEPAVNGYSCLHDSYVFEAGCVEVAITTKEREKYNNWGVMSLDKETLKIYPEKYVRKLVFTPKQELIFMKPSATGIDVAYELNPLIGLRAMAIKIDGKLFDLSTVVPHGSMVEIVTDTGKTVPESHWLSIADQKTKQIIEQQLAVSERDREVDKGREMLVTAVLRERGILNLADIDEIRLKRILMDLGCWNGLRDLYYKVAQGFDLDQVKKKLDEQGISKGRYTTIYLTGVNQIGVFKEVSGLIARYGGDVRNGVEKVDEEEKFMIRILLTVDYAGKKRMEEELKKLYPGCLVV